MANIKAEKPKVQIIFNCEIEMIADLDSTAINNNISRNEVIRTACRFLLKNKKKFNLK